MNRLLVLVLAIGVSSVSGQGAAAEKERGARRRPSPESFAKLVPQVGTVVRMAVTPPVRDMEPGAAAPAQRSPEEREIVNPSLEEDGKPPVRRIVDSVVPDSDGALQRIPPEPSMPSPTVSFEGLNNKDNANVLGLFVLPPDTNGDVGPNHYVQTVNLLFRVYSKAGTPLTAPTRMSSLFAAVGAPCATTNDGDPIVLYDHLADRWLLSQFATAGPPFHQCIAISTTPDPTGTYFAYDFLMPRDKFNDYPHFGVWPDGYYMTDHQFNAALTQYVGQGVMAFDRKKMLVGDPTATLVYFDLNDVDPAIGGMLPSDLDGGPPPLGTANYFAFSLANEFGDPSDAIQIYKFHTDFANPANATFLPVITLPVAAYDPTSPLGRDDIEQPLSPPNTNTTMALDAIQDRLMFRLQYRNFGTHESLVVTHTVNVLPGGTTQATHQAAPRYYELRRSLPSGTFFVNEQATFAPDADNRWMGSAAMDGAGNMAVGYSVSSTSVFPSLRYAGRLASDPPNGLFQGEATLVAGSGVQTSTTSRWGDYSDLTVDPTDGCTFWYTSEYYSNAPPPACSTFSCWQTRIGSFRYPSCSTLPPGSLAGTVTNAATSLPIGGATIEANGYFATTNGAGGYAISNVTPGPYTVNASATGYASASAAVTVTSGATTTQNFALTPVPLLVVNSTTVNDSGGNNNGVIDFNECVNLTVVLRNDGAADATAVSATISTTTPGATVGTNSSTYPNLTSGGGTGSNATPFRISTSPGFVIGTPIQLTLSVNTAQGPFTVPFSVATGTPGAPVAFSATGPIPIPDADPAGASLPISVSGITGTVAKVTVVVHITHTFDSDLTLQLIGPDNTTVTLAAGEGGSGDNFGTDCPADGNDTRFDDASGVPVSAGFAPFVGTFKPEVPLSAFIGKAGSAANGTWQLKVVDSFSIDTGTIDCVTLNITPMVGTNGGGECAQTLSISDVTPTEPDAGSVNAAFTVTPSLVATQPITVDYATAAGTATANVDFTSVSGQLTIPAGARSGTIQVPILGDLCDEPNETFTVNLSNPVNATLADPQGLGTIVDNDPASTISINDVTQLEGDTGSTPATFTVSLSQPNGCVITMDYATTAGTATANVDFTPVSGVLTIPAGSPSGTIQVPVLGDRIDEPDETFTVTLSNATNATFADSSAVGTIADNDPVPAISIDDTFTPEGNAGTTPANFTVSLSNPSSSTIQVNYATADGTATTPADYLPASGTLSFTPGTVTQPVTVQVVGDAAIEPDQDFQVNLTSPVNATIGDGQGIGTISDDDAPSLSLIELEHGSELAADFQGGTADLYRLAQRPRSSYEVVVDEVSGDAVPPSLQRLAGDNVTVLQAGTPVGFGSAVSMRWENRTNGTTTNQHIRIASGACTVGCGADDTYRVRVYETTGQVPRFNNSGSQITVLILQNPTDYVISGSVDFWTAAGVNLSSSAFALQPKTTLVLNTSTVLNASGVSGAMTVTHNGRFGDLTGKAVALEPSTGFSFDTPMLPRRVR